MKILHTSDWHLGLTLSGVNMYDEQKHFIDEICRIASEQQVGAVVIAGDVYDSSVSNSEAISLFSYAADRLCNELGTRVLVVAGNHDGAARLSVYSEITDKAGLFIRGRISKTTEPVCIGDVNFYLLPYFNTDEACALYPDESIENYTQAFEAVCAAAVSGTDKGKVNIAVTHSFITGAETGDSDRAAIVGSAANVSARVFESFDYVCAGHIHKAQDIGANCRYSGTPMRMSFSEANQQKSVTIYDTDTSGRTIVPIEPLHGMKILSGPLDEIISTAAYCEDYVKIELTSGFAGLEQQQMLREFYPNLVMITAKNSFDESEEITLRISDLEALRPQELAENYFREVSGSQPEPRQMQMLIDALAAVEEVEL